MMISDLRREECLDQCITSVARLMIRQLGELDTRYSQRCLKYE